MRPKLTSTGLRTDDPLLRPDGGPLLAWYDANKRDLPWRRTSDPYAIWVSEAMLQQTQVETVLAYWRRWMEVFPSVEALAAADEQAVLALWQGLGYYRRARLLRAGAQWVVEHGMPQSAEAWREVPGVGPYTAAAIASIAQGEAVALVDGNVERVYARLAGDDSEKPALHRAAWKWAERVLYRPRPGDWNQALMELGATVCRPVNARCEECPLEGRCVARQSWRVGELPRPPVKVKSVQLKHAVWIPVFDGKVGVLQIPAGVWWEGMWEFPRADAVVEIENTALRGLVGGGWVERIGVFRHSVTYHRIEVEVSVVRVEEASASLRWVSVEELRHLPLPSPQRRALRILQGLKLAEM